MGDATDPWGWRQPLGRKEREEEKELEEERAGKESGWEMRQILSHLYSQPLELGILVAAVAAQQRERERYVAVGERDDSTRGTDGNRNLGGQCMKVISPLIKRRH